MKKRWKAATIAVLLTATTIVPAGASSFDHCADKLKDLGLFQGTTTGYQLDRVPTRAEAATMLVRMLGKEEAAQSLAYTAPFTDLQNWQEPYVQYLYENGLTSGVRENEFAPESPCSAQMYLTFLLRALGYSEAAGDFTYKDAVAYAQEIGLADPVNTGSDTFLRDHVVATSYTALNMPMHTVVEPGEDIPPAQKLLEKLMEEGAVAEEDATALQEQFKAYDAYVAACTDLNAAERLDMTSEMQAKVTVNDIQFMDISMPLHMQMQMKKDEVDQSKIAMTGTMEMKLNPLLVSENDSTSAKTNIAYYYTNGTYYMNMGDEKTQMPMSFAEARKATGSLIQLNNAEPLSLLESITKEKNKITVTYSTSGLDLLVNPLLNALPLNSSVQGDLTPNIEVATCTITTSKNRVNQIQMDMNLAMVTDNTIRLQMSVNCKINDVAGGMTVELPDDLDSYLPVKS